MASQCVDVWSSCVARGSWWEITEQGEEHGFVMDPPPADPAPLFSSIVRMTLVWRLFCGVEGLLWTDIDDLQSGVRGSRLMLRSERHRRMAARLPRMRPANRPGTELPMPCFVGLLGGGGDIAQVNSTSRAHRRLRRIDTSAGDTMLSAKNPAGFANPRGVTCYLGSVLRGLFQTTPFCKLACDSVAGNACEPACAWRCLHAAYEVAPQCVP